MASESKTNANDMGSLMVESLKADLFKERLDEAVRQHPNKVKIVEPGWGMKGTYFTDTNTSEILMYGEHLDGHDIEFRHILHITKTSAPGQPLRWRADVATEDTYTKVLDKWLAQRQE